MAKLRNYTILLLIFITACSNTSWKLIDSEVEECQKIGKLDAILKERTEAQYALLISQDGLGIVVGKFDFDKVRIEKGKNWQVVAPKLPPSANVRNLHKVCVFSHNFIKIYHENKQFELSPFQIYLENMKFEGAASKNGSFIRKYRRQTQELTLPADSIFIASEKVSWPSLKNRIGLTK